MTVGEKLKKAIVEHDPVAAGEVVNGLRKMGCTYIDVFRLAERLTGISLPEWETLMYEADEEESYG